MSIIKKIQTINSEESLEKFIIDFYLYLEKNNLSIEDSKKIIVNCFSNEFFLELLEDVFINNKNEDIFRLFIQLSFLWFTSIINSKNNIYFDDEYFSKIKSIFYFWEESLLHKFEVSIILHSIIDILLDFEKQKRFSVKIKWLKSIDSFFVDVQKKSNILWIVFFSSFNYEFSLKSQLQRISSYNKINDKNNLLFNFEKIYWIINKSSWLVKWQLKLWYNMFGNNNITYFLWLVRSKKDELSYKIINLVVSDFPTWYIEDFNFWKILFPKIKKMIKDKEKINEIIEKDLFDFNRWNIWYIDKICFITLKIISIFEVIEKSKNSKWKIKVIVREFYNWIEELYNIVNKFDIIDDWEYVKKFLVEENDQIEWKSSFLTPVKKDNPNFKKDNYLKISQTIISMLNTNWGKILIWHIEDLQWINDKIKYFKREKYYFFDIKNELNKFKTSIDEIVRDLQEIIKQELNCNIIDFDNLFWIEEKLLKINWESISIYFINIERSDEIFYSLFKIKDWKKDKYDSRYITLRKRVKWKNECINPYTKKD